MEIVTLPRGPAGVEWRRSKRARLISLRIDVRRAVVVVTLPIPRRRGAGRRFLMSQADWVIDRLAALPRAVPFADGAALILHGRSCRVRHLPTLEHGPCLRNGELQVAGCPELLARRVGEFLRGEARRALTARVAAKAGRAGVQPARILVKDPTSRWGSCAADGTLSFSWRLVMAPAYVQDYVAGHEVAHLRHMDHGPGFWDLVQKLTPHRVAAVTWLRARGPQLLRVG